MGSYSGRVVLVDGDGNEVGVNAAFVSTLDPISGLREWHGTLHGSADWFALMEQGELTVRLPNGTEGRLFLTDVSAGSSDLPAAIMGTGPAPFFVDDD